MNLLKRELAPLTPEAWAEVDREAKRVLTLHLAARKVVDFVGPQGWTAGAVSTGRLGSVQSPLPGVEGRLRVVQPLVELRAPFALPIDELDAASRGAADLDLEPLIRAAEKIAQAEDHAIFHGWSAAAIEGILPSSKHAPVSYAAAEDLPFAVASAKETLRRAGVGGPHALVLGSRAYDELQASAEDGYPIRRRVQALVDAIEWAPALEGGALVSTRGGDFELTVGQDLSIGYEGTRGGDVLLYLTESFTFRVLEDTAAVAIVPAGVKTQGPLGTAKAPKAKRGRSRR